MSKKFIIVAAVVVIAIVALAFLRGEEDTWLCVNSQWIKHGNPKSSMPEGPCGNSVNQQDEFSEEIMVTSPLADQLIQSPLMVEGKARGNWFFEASFPVKLVDEGGRELVSSNVQATSDWMTSDFVPFSGQLTFLTVGAKTGYLVLQRDNPSGLKENDKELKVPVRFAEQETQTLKLFFNNNQLDPEVSCNKVFPVERIVPKTQTPARAALELLLGGPLTAEKEQGFFSSINEGVKIQSLTIENGTAKVDFNEQMEYQMGGSCRVSAIRAEITETLKQFSTVQNVVISVNGRTEDILQP